MTSNPMTRATGARYLRGGRQPEGTGASTSPNFSAM